MSPMSLVTLPASALSEDALSRRHDSPCGERSERRLALWASAGAAVAVIVLVALARLL
jgi:hypothetical protein